MRLLKALISCVAMTAATAVSEVASAQASGYNQLTIVNNFQPSLGGTPYFGIPVPDDAIWLYIPSDRSTVCLGGERNGVGAACTNCWNPGSWKSLNTIKNTGNGNVWLPRGASSGRILAVIYGGDSPPPINGDTLLNTPNPTTISNSCDVTSYAFGLFEYDTSNPLDGNCDISFVDQFSFPQRLSVGVGGSGSTRGQNGFKNGTTAQAYLSSLTGEYGYAAGGAGTNTP